MILEAIVTTLGGDGALNVAPMGARVEPGMSRFTLHPYRTSTTYRNLKASGEGVLHVTDDVLLLARAAIGPVNDEPTRAAERVRGQVLLSACRYDEFRVTDLDDQAERTTVLAETVHRGRFRDVFGFNRAKHAVIEAAILATRTDFLPIDEIGAEYRKLDVIVRKTGGPRELQALALLRDHVESVARQRGVSLDQDQS